MWFVIGFFSSMCSCMVIIFDKWLRIEDKDEFEKVECVQLFFDYIRGKGKNITLDKILNNTGKMADGCEAH